MDDSQAFTFGTAHYAGVARSNTDYGHLDLFSRSELDDRHDAPDYTTAYSGGAFVDVLTISGGAAGATIQADLRFQGTGSILFFDGGFPMTRYGLYARPEFYVYDGTSWVSAPDQTFGEHDDGVYGSTIDYTGTVTLANYDPTKLYALVANGVITTEVDSANLPGSVYAQAQGTGRISQIGFVGANGGLSGRFVGSSGFVYGSPVPEPASLAILGAGLAFLRRRRR